MLLFVPRLTSLRNINNANPRTTSEATAKGFRPSYSWKCTALLRDIISVSILWLSLYQTYKIEAAIADRVAGGCGDAA